MPHRHETRQPTIDVLEFKEGSPKRRKTSVSANSGPGDNALLTTHSTLSRCCHQPGSNLSCLCQSIIKTRSTAISSHRTSYLKSKINSTKPRHAPSAVQTTSLSVEEIRDNGQEQSRKQSAHPSLNERPNRAYKELRCVQRAGSR